MSSLTIRSVARRSAVGAGLLALGAQISILAATATASGCLVDREPADRWNPIPTPPDVEVVSLVQLDGDPCRLVAADRGTVWITGDGGQRWTKTYQVRPERPIAGLFAEGMHPGRVVVAQVPDVPVDAAGRTNTGVLLSEDRGATFQDAAVPGMTEMDLVAAVAEPQAGGDLLYLAARTTSAAFRAAQASTMFEGNSNSFIPLPGSALLSPSRVVVSPTTRGELWANDEPIRGGASALWRSTDSGRTWTSKESSALGQVHDLALTFDESARSESLLVAADFGVLRSVDRGATWQQILVGAAATAVRAEQSDPDVLMAVVDGRPRRGRLPGPLSPAVAGLPSECESRDLAVSGQKDRPSTFLISCGTRFYRYRSHGDDLEAGGPSAPSTSPPPPPPPSLPSLPALPLPTQSSAPIEGVPMPLALAPLRTVSLPGTDTYSGNLALVGHTLYYTDGEAGVKWSQDYVAIRRVDVLTGAPLPDLVVRLGPLTSWTREYRDWTSLYGDNRRNALYIETYRGGPYVGGDYRSRVLTYDLASGDLTSLFVTTKKAHVESFRNYWQLNYDPSLDQFAAVQEGGTLVRHVDRKGSFADDGCENHYAVGGSSSSSSTVLPVGDEGGVYVEMENDQELVRLGRDCRLIAVYTHRTVSEANQENDGLACDSVHFGVPAVWIRDAQLNSATAYALPLGFCPPPGLSPVTQQPEPGTVPPVPASAPIPAPQPQPQPGPAQQPAPQAQPQLPAQPIAQAQPHAQAQQQAQQQVQQQAQQQAQAGVVGQRQQQHQVAGVHVGAQSAQEQYATSRYRRQPLPVPLGAGGVVLLGAYGVLLAREWQARKARV